MNSDENKKLSELHRFFMEPPAPGRPSRAQEIDEALMVLRSGKTVSRIIVVACGFIIAISSGLAALKGWGFWK